MPKEPGWELSSESCVVQFPYLYDIVGDSFLLLWPIINGCLIVAVRFGWMANQLSVSCSFLSMYSGLIIFSVDGNTCLMI